MIDIVKMALRHRITVDHDGWINGPIRPDRFAAYSRELLEEARAACMVHAAIPDVEPYVKGRRDGAIACANSISALLDAPESEQPQADESGTTITEYEE